MIKGFLVYILVMGTCVIMSMLGIQFIKMFELAGIENYMVGLMVGGLIGSMLTIIGFTRDFNKGD